MSTPSPDVRSAQDGSHPPVRIYLTGFMGSGKTTVGPILANTLGYTFHDIDKAIEERTGRTVVDIFATDGEEYFRSIERDVLRELSEKEACVISLGGGTIASEENFRYIKQHGVLIYLQLSEEDILKRVRHRPDRPLLHDGEGGLLSGEDLELKVRTLLRARLPFYQMSDLVVPSHARQVGLTVDAIVKALKKVR